MANAKLDQNSRQTLTALSSANDGTIVELWADPTTHALLTDISGTVGTVTSVSVVSANGFAGTVATATSTPAITLSTTITGILSGNGTAISAASTTGSGSVVLSGSPSLTTPSIAAITVSGGIMTLPTGSSDTLVGKATTDTLTNKTMTGATNTLTASLLKSATTEVSVSAATAPSSGQVLTATSSTTATWQTPAATGANTALSNLAAVAINTSLLPGTDDGAALGSTTKEFSDLFLASGGVINWAAGDVTITHSANRLSFDGASSGYGFDSTVQVINTAGVAANIYSYLDTPTSQIASFAANIGTVADGNEGYISLQVRNDASTLADFARITWTATDINVGTGMDGALAFSVVTAGSMAKEVVLDGTSFSPFVSDGNALGTSSLMWSDLFLASGGVINFNNGNMTLTHSTGNLTLAGGTFTAPTLVGGTGTTSTLTLQPTSGVGTTGADIIFNVGNNGATEAMRVASSGNIGIGTANPSFALDISVAAPRIRQTATTGTNSSLIQLANTGGTAYIGLDNASAGISAAYALALYHSGAYPITFSTSGTEAMRLDANRNLLVGTTSQVYSEKLAVQNDQNSATYQLIRNNNSGASGASALALNAYGNSWGIEIGSTAKNSNALTFNVDYLGTPVERMRLTTDGNIGLGTTPSAWHSNFKVLQTGLGYASFVGDSSNGYAEVLNNCYASAASTYNYVASLAATRYSQQLGVHKWYAASAGTGGAAITFTDLMTLNLSGLSIGTSLAFTTGTIELGAASDTTISRSAAGQVAIEGVQVSTVSNTVTLTNKRVTKRVVTVNAPGATPTTNTDNCDIAAFTGLSAAITSMTTNLSGTPVNGDMLMFQFTDNGTARAITWGASFASTTVTLPTTTVISTLLRVLVQWNSTSSKWECIGTA